MDIEAIVAAANSNENLMDGTTAPVQAIIASAEIVYGVYPDEGKSGGFGTYIIKGYARLQSIADGSEPAEVSWTAIQCTDREYAIAAQQELGEAA